MERLHKIVDQEAGKEGLFKNTLKSEERKCLYFEIMMERYVIWTAITYIVVAIITTFLFRSLNSIKVTKVKKT